MKALIIFAKAPVAGTVKTRLKPYLSPSRILSLYKGFVKETVSSCMRVKGVKRFMGCTPAKEHNFFDTLAGANNITCFNQRGKNLKEKILNAFEDHFKAGFKEIVLVGSDSPTMPAEYIKKAFSELKNNDLVIGPCFDGGLYLIGSRRDKLRALLRNIPLETGADVTSIVGKMNRINSRFSMLPFWYDVDTIEDLRLYREHLKYLNRKKPVLKI